MGSISSNFNYKSVDDTVADFLRRRETNMREIVGKAYTDIGRELKEAQEELSKKGYGCFQEWAESLGFKRQTVYNLIQRYDLIVQNLDEQDLLEEIPLSLMYEIASPSSEKTSEKAQAKSEVLSGEIATLKAYKERIQELEAANKQAESRVRIAEKDSEILRDTLEYIEDREPEIQYVEKEPEDYQRIKDELERLKAKADETEDPGDYRSYGMKLAKEMYKAFDEMSQWQKNYAWLITDKSEFKRLADSDKDFEREFRRLDEFWRQLSDAFNGLNRKDISDNIIDVVVD